MTRAQIMSLLKQQQQRGNFREALDIFNAASRQKGFRHNQATYAVMIHILGHAHKFKAMELLLNRMKQEPFKFRSGVFADVIRVYGRAGMPEKAINTFYTALQSFKCKYGQKLFNTLLKVLINIGCLDMAADTLFFNDLKEFGICPSVFSYNLLIKAFCKANKLDLALKLVAHMQSQGCPPDVITFGTLIGGLCESGRVEEALGTLNEMRDKGCDPDVVVYNTIINGLSRDGQLERANDMLLKMESRGCKPDVITYNTLINGFCKMGKGHKAIGLLREDMLEKGVDPDVITFSTLMNFLYEVGKLQDCKSLFDEMAAKGLSPDVTSYNILIKALCKENMIADAICIVHNMNCGDTVPSVASYKVIIDSLCDKGMISQARQILVEALKKGLVKATIDHGIQAL